MNSRFGLVILTTGCVALAGCANWQNRAGSANAPGNAAGLNLAPAPAQGPLLAAPGTSLGEPPPPVPPPASDPFMTLPPTGAPATGERLDLTSVESKPAPAPAKMYNLESSSRKTADADEKATPKRSSTISRLAEKSEPRSEPKTTPKAEPKTVASRPSTLDRLRKASSDEAPAENPTPTSLPRPGKVEEPAAPAVSEAPAPKAAPVEDAAVDTTLLAQPVRKGADSKSDADKKESKGPQSRLLPSTNLFKGDAKPVIYPVSNPAVEERVDVTRFS